MHLFLDKYRCVLDKKCTIHLTNKCFVYTQHLIIYNRISAYAILTLNVIWHIFLHTISMDKQTFFYVIHVFMGLYIVLYTACPWCTYSCLKIGASWTRYVRISTRCSIVWYISCLRRNYFKTNIGASRTRNTQDGCWPRLFFETWCFPYKYTCNWYGKSDIEDKILLSDIFLHVITSFDIDNQTPNTFDSSKTTAEDDVKTV